MGDRWRTLDDDDVRMVLEELGQPWAGKVDRRALGNEINSWIAGCDIRPNKPKTPDARLRELRELRGSLLRTLTLLLDADRDFAIHELDAALPTLTTKDLRTHKIARRLTGRETVDAIRLLRLVTAACEEREKLRQKYLARKGKKRIDRTRYLFIAHLAHTFERLFGTRATAYEAGPWCSFLAIVLSRCENEKIDNGGARWLWNQLLENGQQWWHEDPTALDVPHPGPAWWRAPPEGAFAADLPWLKALPPGWSQHLVDEDAALGDWPPSIPFLLGEMYLPPEEPELPWVTQSRKRGSRRDKK